MDDLFWFVAHTRPRCEKKLAEYAGKEKISVTLPCIRTAHKYRGKTAVFHKPLFPGYVFLRMRNTQRQTIYQSDYVANLLDVADQAMLERQLDAVLRALESEMEIRLAPQIVEGTRVRILSGSLRGIEGVVQQRSGITTVFLRVDFISQAAAVKMSANELELI